MCVCSLRYPASNAHEPYRHLFSAPIYTIFPNCLIKGTIFRKVIGHEMCVSSFSTVFSEIFFILRRTERDMIEIMCWSSLKILVFVSDFNET